MCNFGFWGLAALCAEVSYCDTFIYIRSLSSPVSLTLKMATAMYADMLQHIVQLNLESWSYMQYKISCLSVIMKIWMFHQVCLVVDHLYGVLSKIIHVTKGLDLNHHVPSLMEHFNRYGSPLMMGGDHDCSAKAVMGIHASDSDVYLLIVVRLHYTTYLWFLYILWKSVMYFISVYSLFNMHA